GKLSAASGVRVSVPAEYECRKNRRQAHCWREPGHHGGASSLFPLPMRTRSESPGHTPKRNGMTFEELGLAPELVQRVKELGYDEPTPIQAMAIPEAMAGRDVLGRAQTGTGKT